MQDPPATIVELPAGTPPRHSSQVGLLVSACQLHLARVQSLSYHHAKLFSCSRGHAWHAWHAGNFTADQTDDLTDYKPDELASIFRWRNFFRDHKVFTL